MFCAIPQISASSSKEDVEKFVSTAVLRMTLGFVCLFCAFSATKSLQTGLRADGFICLASIYSTFTLSAALAAPVVAFLGIRWSLAISAIPYVVFVFVNAASDVTNEIPACVFVGLTAPVLWGAQGAYLGRAAQMLHVANGEEVTTATNRLGGKFFQYFRLTGACGCLVAIVVLFGVDELQEAELVLFLLLGVVGLCGVLLFATLPHMHLEPLEQATGDDGEEEVVEEGRKTIEEEPSDNAVVLVVENEKKVNEEEQQLTTDVASKPPSKVLEDSLRILRTSFAMVVGDIRMGWMAPISIFHGLSMGWFFGDVLGIMVQKPLGVRWDAVGGFVFFGTTAITSKFLPSLTKNIGRKGALLMSFVLYLMVWVVSTSWNVQSEPASPGLIVGLLALIAVFGIADAVVEVLAPAILQSYFAGVDDNLLASQTLYKLCQSLGFTIQFTAGAIMTETHTSVQIRAVLLMVIASISYILVWQLHKKHPIE